MKVEQIYTGCLAQGAYYIISDGEAAIIDPLREVTPYLQRLEKDNVRLKYIFETHFHADFVSGHVSLSKKTGASIVYGPTASPNFETLIAEDGQEFPLGKGSITAIHTPGHTMESTTYLLKDEKGKEIAIFSGDTLFLGDVGRPDLAQNATGLTTEDLAGILYESLREKIMPLDDSIIVYPGHGAGSACGKNMSKETVDTLGNQKKTNYALRADMTKEEFIEEVTSCIPEPPAYFPLNVELNKKGYTDIDLVLEKGLTPLSANALEAIANEKKALILDVREVSDFAQCHIPKSIFIGLKGGFAPWVGALIKDINQPILLVAEPGSEEEAVTRLARVGFDYVLGYLEGGFSSWLNAGKETDSVISITPEEFEQRFASKQIPIFDVRKEGEYNTQHIVNSNHSPLSKINEYLSEFPKEETFYIHCAGGYRSMIAASILKSKGIHNLVDIKGGFEKIKLTSIPLSQRASCKISS